MVLHLILSIGQALLFSFWILMKLLSTLVRNLCSNAGRIGRLNMLLWYLPQMRILQIFFEPLFCRNKNHLILQDRSLRSMILFHIGKGGWRLDLWQRILYQYVNFSKAIWSCLNRWSNQWCREKFQKLFEVQKEHNFCLTGSNQYNPYYLD